MSKAKQTKIEVQGTAITVLSQKEQDCICLTDIARFKNPERSDDLVRTGCALVIRLSSSASGSGSTTPVLIPSNSTELEFRQV